MDRIEFDAAVEEGGVIHIPAEYTRELARARKVHVAVTPEDDEPLTVKRMREHPVRTKLVERMENHPFHDPNFKPLSREEIYDRGKREL